MRATLVLAALIVAVPAVAGAQDAAERRRQQMDENFRQLEQTQRIGEVERQLSNMEIRRQSDDVLRTIQQPAAITKDNTYVLAPPPVTYIAVSPENVARDAELAASNARLKEIAKAQRGQ